MLSKFLFVREQIQIFKIITEIHLYICQKTLK